MISIRYSIHLVTEDSSFTSKQFAVLAFLLQRYQQGSPLPRHLPMALRSVLPPRGPRSTWSMSSAKEEELRELWREVIKKEKGKKGTKNDDDDDGVVSVNGLKNQVMMITKNASTTRKMYENGIVS